MSQSTVWSVAGVVLQILVVVAGAPVLIALMRQVRARLEGRVGAGLGALAGDEVAGSVTRSPLHRSRGARFRRTETSGLGS